MQKIEVCDGSNSFLPKDIEINCQGNFKVAEIPQKVKDFSKEIKKENTPKRDSYEPSTGAKAAGFLLGMPTLGLTTNAIKLPLSLRCMSLIKKLGENLTDAEFTTIKDAAEKGLNETGLAGKGIEFIKASKDNVAQVENIIKTEVKNKPIARFLPKIFKDIIIKINTDMLTSGKNACYTMASKKIIIPTQKELSWAVFHEMGHAMNANFSKIGRLLQKSRCATLLVIPILLTALLKNKKQEGVKTEGVFDKTTTFVKENAGKLTFAAFAPMLIEEGMASIKGNGIAKKLLNPELAKKVAKGNKIAYLTYLGTALAISIGVYFAKKVRDKVAAPKKAAV